MNITVSWRTERLYKRPLPVKVKRLAERAAELAGTGLTNDGQLGISFLSSKKMTEVNWDFLSHTGDTDVICFDYRENDGTNDGGFDENVDILICPNVANREAEKRALPYAQEVTLYLIHGLLHAAGYDDLKPELKRKMRRAEKRVMTAILKEFDLNRIFRKENELLKENV